MTGPPCVAYNSTQLGSDNPLATSAVAFGSALMLVTLVVTGVMRPFGSLCNMGGYPIKYTCWDWMTFGLVVEVVFWVVTVTLFTLSMVIEKNWCFGNSLGNAGNGWPRDQARLAALVFICVSGSLIIFLQLCDSVCQGTEVKDDSSGCCSGYAPDDSSSVEAASVEATSAPTGLGGATQARTQRWTRKHV